jgi:hypothetical protein
MAHLPPDLARVGDELAAAAARSLRDRRRRAVVAARWGLTAAGALLVAAVLAASALAPGRHAAPAATLPAFAALDSAGLHVNCDQPRGANAGLPACVRAAPHMVRSTLPHGAPSVRE